MKLSNTKFNTLKIKLNSLEKKIHDATTFIHKIPDNSKYITTQEFSKLNTENFVATLKQADLLNKTLNKNKILIMK